jgi:predicted Zn-dependent protease
MNTIVLSVLKLLGIPVKIKPYKITLIQTDGAYAIGQNLRQDLEREFNADVRLLKGEMPVEAYYPERMRYRAAKILTHLALTSNLKENEYVMMVTTKDISDSRNKFYDWGIMGMSDCPGNVSVVSTFRTGDKHNYNKTLKKIAIHEFSRNLGLQECDNYYCIMADKERRGMPAEREIHCKKCKSKLKKHQREHLIKNALTH